MSKKIVIMGALGYLGSELCKLYSGESFSIAAQIRYYEIQEFYRPSGLPTIW